MIEDRMTLDENVSPTSYQSDDDEDNIFGSIYIHDEFFEDEGAMHSEKSTNKSRTRPARNWGIPTFSDQIDRSIMHYDLHVSPHTIRLNLEFRKNSTGSDMWDSALVLANYLPYLNLEGKRIVELGSGVGAVGLMCKRFGARVTLTDLPENCDLIRRNAMENGYVVKGHETFFSPENNGSISLSDDNTVNVCQLLWGTTLEHLPSHLLQQGGVDFVLGSDLFLPFATDLLEPLCITIAALLQASPANAQSILVYEERFDCSKFWTMCEQHGLDVEVMSDENLPFCDPGRIFILKITRQVVLDGFSQTNKLIGES